jgi:hypothetical protein
MVVAKRFSITNFFIATSALAFQVFVLYPWHKRLDDDFEALKKEHSRVLLAVEKSRVEELVEIKKFILDSKAKEASGWGRWR